MLNRYDHQRGDIVRIRDHHPDNATSYHIFRGWSTVPEHVRAGRIAELVWCFNGTPSSSWEADLAPEHADPETVRALITAAHATNPCNRATPRVELEQEN